MFTQKQSERIFDSLAVKRPLRGDPFVGNVRTTASAQERVKAKGRTVARSGAKSSQKVALDGEARSPWIANGCWIAPNTNCAFHDLSEAGLFEADLHGSYLAYSSFRYAYLVNANLSGAILCGTTMPDGSLNSSSCP